MESIKRQVSEFSERYSPYFRLLISNMRLVLLIAFSIMSGYLVFRVDSLVNKEIELPPDDNSQSSSLNKKPDRNVISVFNELYVQDVELNSDFDATRDNPF